MAIQKVTDPVKLIQSAGIKYQGNDADQTYILSPALVSAGDMITIIDQGGNNEIQFATGLEITGAIVTNDEMQITLSNGAVINIRGASTFTFNIGGNDAAGVAGVEKTFAEFVAEALNTTVPAADEAPNNFEGSAIMNQDGTVNGDGGGTTPPPPEPGNEFVLTTDVDNLVLTDEDDVIVGESATIGENDKILDTSITDHDVMNIKLISDMKPLSVNNVEEINIDIDTLGGTTVDANDIDGAKITVSSATPGFSGIAIIDNLDDNDAVAGSGITNLQVSELRDGLIDTGAASKLDLTWTTAGRDVNLKINGDVAMTANQDYNNLNVEATADATLDISSDSATNNMQKSNSVITGEGNLILKVDNGSGITTKEIANDGTGELTIEIESDAGAPAVVDLTDIDTDKLILDATTLNNSITFNGQLDVTAKMNHNVVTFTGDEDDNGGGSLGTSVNLHLLQAAVTTNEDYEFIDMETATIDAQKGGVIDSIDTVDGVALTKDANLVIKAGKDLTVTAIDALAKSVQLDAATAGNVTFTSVSAASVVATLMEKDFTMTQVAAPAEDINILGGKAKNNISTVALTTDVAIKTQDGADTININAIADVTLVAATTGKVTIDTAGGDDKVTAAGNFDTNAFASTNASDTIDLGDGKDVAAVGNLAGGKLILTSLTGDDLINVDAKTAGTMVISTGADNDTINVGVTNADTEAPTSVTGTTVTGVVGVVSGANITVNAEAGNDNINIDSLAADTTVLDIDGGDGTDTVEVTKAADFTAADLTLDNIESLKIDEIATFMDNQLNDKTFTVSSGTANVDVLKVTLDTTTGTPSPQDTNLGDLKFSSDTSLAVEYTMINADSSVGVDKIIGAHNTANIIDLGAGDGEDTVQLFADSMGTKIDNLGLDVDIDANGTGTEIVSADMLAIDVAANQDKMSFDISIINNFESGGAKGDTLILGDGATSSNFASLGINFLGDDLAAGTAAANGDGLEDFMNGLAASNGAIYKGAITLANEYIDSHAGIEFVYAYDSSSTADADADGNAEAIITDAFLLWDSDHNGSVDAAILLVGVEAAAAHTSGIAQDGTGFVAADIIGA